MDKNFEELYLESEQAIKAGDLVTASRLIEEMLTEDPTSAIAHNLMGWFCRVQFEDNRRAELHYKSAIKFDPEYPHAYWNYANLLLDLERFDEMVSLMEACKKVPTLNKSIIQNQLAEMWELKGDFAKAIYHYKQAIIICLKTDQIETFYESVKRCEDKIRLMDEMRIEALTPAELMALDAANVDQNLAAVADQSTGEIATKESNLTTESDGQAQANAAQNEAASKESSEKASEEGNEEGMGEEDVDLPDLPDWVKG